MSDRETTGAEAEVVRALGRGRVLPVLSADGADQAEAACRALLRGGISCVEITFRTEAAVEAIARARTIGGLLVGAGTVVSADQARLAVEAGARFAVAPGLRESVVEACRELGLPFFPGVATPTEIDRARGLGARILKVFPAQAVGGPAFLRAVSATFPDVRFLPTGGIGPATLAGYLAVPSVLACAGSWVCEPGLLRAGDFAAVERLAREAVGPG